jgi:hypothetical protein
LRPWVLWLLLRQFRLLFLLCLLHQLALWHLLRPWRPFRLSHLLRQ